MNKLGYLSASYLVILSAYNMIDLLIDKDPLTDFVLYVGVFLISILAVLLSQHYKKEEPVHGVIFLIFGVMCAVVGDVGVAILLFCYTAYFIGQTTKILIIIGVITIVSILFRGYLDGQSALLTINYIFLYAYFFALYYITFHPKPVKLDRIPGLSGEQLEIIQYLIQGYTAKEITGKLTSPISTNAVYKRISYIREKYGYRTTEQMIYDLAKNGRLRQTL